MANNNNNTRNAISQELRQKIYALAANPEVWEQFLPYRLERVGRCLRTICPFHPDTTPSFFLRESNGTLRFKCFGASCQRSGDFIDFISYLKNISKTQAAQFIAKNFLNGNGQTPTQSYPQQSFAEQKTRKIEEIKINEELKAKAEAVYIFRDLFGEKLYVKYRLPNKEFMITPSGKKSIFFNLENLKAGEIFFAEGEKDCLNLSDFLSKNGYEAASVLSYNNFAQEFKNTCKLHPEFFEEIIAQSYVYICPDHDEAGYAKASEAILTLRNKCLSLRVLIFPERNQKTKGYDISDFLTENRGKEEFERLLTNCSNIVNDPKEASQVFIIDENTNFAYFLQPGCTTAVLTEKELLEYGDDPQELFPFFEGKVLYIDEKIWQQSKKLCYLFLSFSTAKTFIIQSWNKTLKKFDKSQKLRIFTSEALEERYSQVLALLREQAANRNQIDLSQAFNIPTPLDPLLCLPKGDLALLVGPGEAGKTTMGLLILYYLLYENYITKACFLSFEEDLNQLEYRLISLKHNLPTPCSDRIIALFYENNTQTRYVYALCDFLLRKYDILIVDNLAKIFRGDENDNSTASSFLQFFNSLCAQTGKTVILIHHVSQDFFSLYRTHFDNFFQFIMHLQKLPRGATSFSNHVRSVYMMLRFSSNDEQERETFLFQIKANLSTQHNHLHIRHFSRIARRLEDKLHDTQRFEISEIFHRMSNQDKEDFINTYFTSRRRNQRNQTRTRR